jgi:hypothetical protein
VSRAGEGFPDGAGRGAVPGWHFDRKVPISLVAALLLQAGATVWWGASMSARVAALEEKIGISSDQGARLIRVETQVDYVHRSLEAMDRKLDRIIQQRLEVR